MKGRIGRPKLPKGTAKGILIATKVSQEEFNKIAKDIKDSGLNEAAWAREAFRAKTRPEWLICDKWGAKDLHHKTVEFKLKAIDRQTLKFSTAQGFGRFIVMEHLDGFRLAIEIHSRTPFLPQRLSLNKMLADAIEQHHDQSLAEFQCFVEMSTD